MGLFGIILRNVDLDKKDKERIHELVKHSQKNKKDENKTTKSHDRNENAKSNQN